MYGKTSSYNNRYKSSLAGIFNNLMMENNDFINMKLTFSHPVEKTMNKVSDHDMTDFYRESRFPKLITLYQYSREYSSLEEMGDDYNDVKF